MTFAATAKQCLMGLSKSAYNLVSKLIYSKRNRLLFAFILTILLMVLMTLTNRYAGGTDDDWAISLALSGRYPDSGLCLFVNAAVSQITVALNELFPDINWFLTIELLITAAAFFTIVYGSLTYMKPLFAFLLIGAVEAFVLPGCTYESNFTFVAGIAAIAGFIILVGTTKTRSRSVLMPLVGICFCTIGFLWRSEVLLLSLPFFAIALGFIFLSRQGKKDHGIKPITFESFVRATIPYIAVIVICGCFYVYNNIAWQDPDWAAWKEFNSARSEISDYPMPDYEKVADKLSAQGLSQNDYYGPMMWVTADPEVYSLQTMEFIASLASTFGPADYLNNYFTYLNNVVKSLPSHIIVVVVIAVVMILISRKKTALPQVLVSIMLAVIICAYFAALGRLPERVETAVWLFSLCAIFLSIKHNAYDDDPEMAKAKQLAPYKHNEVLAAAAGAGMWAGATLLVLALTVPMFNPSLLPAYLDQNSFKTNNPAVKYASRDDGKILVWGISSYFDVEHAYRLKFLPPENLLKKNFYLGGWTDRAPFTMANREQAGMTNVIRGLADNPNAYLVTEKRRESTLPSFILSFIQQHYYSDATIEQVDSFAGHNPEDTFIVWKIHKNE